MSYDIIKEDVPNLVKRYGDRVIAGSNNSTMIFGTDRSAPGEASIDSGYGSQPGAGSWHVIVGMKGSNPNFDTDDSYVYMSRKTDADTNMGLDGIEFVSDGRPSIMLKSNSIRIVARDDLKIKVGSCYITMKNDGTIVLDGKIKLGSNAVQSIVRGQAFMSLYNSHTHTCPSGGGISTKPIIQMTSTAHLSGNKFTD